ncbi:MAG: eukaryotic-like serine/threonine-protein kinase [Verrucomicrobiota bacterium]|jgi:Skp family chaperone for outer membrane proteins
MEELDPGQTVRGFVPGQKLFGRYVLQAILGRGGMGIVWRALDEHLERDVALKFLPELIIHDPAVLDDLKRETRRNLDLTHHHIVRIYDFAQDSQSACISMEFVDGETLSALRVARPDRIFRPDELAQPMEELCEALTYAHGRAAIVHRDLKPANLMLTSKGVLKVTDFGIARSLSDSISMLTMGRGISGTLLYMSPQQLNGERASATDDIYSVGATIYELLTSKPPFFTGSIERQIEEKIPPPMAARRSDLGIMSDVPIPEHWERCVADCLAKEPGKRPASAATVAERLRGEVAPSESRPRPTPAPVVVAATAPSPAPAREHRPRTVLYIGVLAAVVLLAGVVALFLNRSSTEPTATSAAVSPTESVASAAPSAAPPAPSVAPISTPAKSVERYSASAGFDPSLATVDLNRIFKEYGRTKESEAKVNSAKAAAKKEYDDRAANYKKLLDQFNAASSQPQRDELAARAKAMEKEINDFRVAREKQLQDQASSLRTELVKEITDEITRLNATAGSVVLDRSGNSLNGVPVLVFSPESSDMTTRVVTAMNDKKPAAFSAVHDMPVGIVDMNAIFKNYDKTKDAEAKINDAKNAAKKEYDQRVDNYKKALAAINDLNRKLESTSLSASARTSLTRQRDDAVKAIKVQEKEINDFRQARERQLQEQALRMREGLVKEIVDAIGGGLPRGTGALIVDASGMSQSGVSLMPYSRGLPNLSAEVISFLNAKRGGTIKFQQPLVSSKTLRFAVVDMNRAFKAWPETQAAETKINEAKEAARKEYDNAKATRTEKEASDFRATREKELQDQAKTVRDGLVAKIVAALQKRAERENFNVVFDSSGQSLNGVPVVTVAPGLPDLTDGLETE